MPNPIIVSQNVPVQMGQANSGELGSARSAATSSSSRLSEPKDLELSFDTNSYSNFHIPTDNENETPRNKQNIDLNAELSNVPNASGGHYALSNVPNGIYNNQKNLGHGSL